MNCNIPQTWKGKCNFFFIYKIKILRSLIYIYIYIAESDRLNVPSHGATCHSLLYIYIYMGGKP